MSNAVRECDTFVEMTDLMPNAKAMASRVLRWAIKNLPGPKGFFYFQRHRVHTNKIPYMRRAQRWMLCALKLLSLQNAGKQ